MGSVADGFDRRPLGDRGGWALVPTTLEDDGIVAIFTERTGGDSHEAFTSLNLSFAVEDEPGAVRANRSTVAEALGVAAFATGEQVHGDTVAEVTADRAAAGFGDAASRIPGTDGLATTEPDLAVAVLSADCLPIVLASAEEGRIVVVHAGWRGLAAGILDRTVDGFARPETTRAAIGPAIGPDHYEVGEEVVAAVDAAVSGGAVVERRDGSIFLDLAASAAAALRARGVPDVAVAGLCTACHPDRFFSHRGDAGRTGRQGVVAVRRM
jgi:YfiH family protein